MRKLRVARELFRKTPLSRWPRLGSYFFGSLLYRSTGKRLFKEKVLQLEDLRIVADVEGRCGLVFWYEIACEKLYENGTPPITSGVIFDAGANCGYFALTRCLANPALRAYCFEPHPRTFQNLVSNIAANSLESRVIPTQAAVGAKSGKCQMNISPESSMAVVVEAGMDYLQAPTTIDVPLVALDDFAQQSKVWPDELKIDVEGFEVEVLRGAQKCLNHARRVVMECHSDELILECRKMLEEKGFSTSLKDATMFAVKKA